MSAGPVYPYREDRHLDRAREAAATMVADCLDEAGLSGKPMPPLDFLNDLARTVMK